jgi:hypothetical protein
VYDFNSQSLTVDATFTFVTIVENKKYLTKIEEVIAWLEGLESLNVKVKWTFIKSRPLLQQVHHDLWIKLM